MFAFHELLLGHRMESLLSPIHLKPSNEVLTQPQSAVCKVFRSKSSIPLPLMGEKVCYIYSNQFLINFRRVQIKNISTYLKQDEKVEKQHRRKRDYCICNSTKSGKMIGCDNLRVSICLSWKYLLSGIGITV